MPKFRVRLESPDHMQENGDPHFRITTLTCDDADQARRFCEANERRLAAHEYPSEIVAQLEEIEAESIGNGERVPTGPRGKLAIHRQTTPCAVVSVEEV